VWSLRSKIAMNNDFPCSPQTSFLPTPLQILTIHSWSSETLSCMLSLPVNQLLVPQPYVESLVLCRVSTCCVSIALSCLAWHSCGWLHTGDATQMIFNLVTAWWLCTSILKFALFPATTSLLSYFSARLSIPCWLSTMQVITTWNFNLLFAFWEQWW